MTTDVLEEVLEKPTPTLFEHCVAVFQEMEGQARDEGAEGLIYEGHLTKLFNQLGLSAPYYTSVMRRLKQMDCVVQVRRGGGTSTSRWRLVRVPSEESFRSHEDMKVRPNGKYATLEQGLRSAHERINELVDQINDLYDMLEERDARNA